MYKVVVSFIFSIVFCCYVYSYEVEDFGDDSFIEVKRLSPNQFHMGFGKRAPAPERFHMGFGKRSGDDEEINYMKRLDASKFHMGFGKRSVLYDDSEYVKRMDPTKIKAFGFGKRSSEIYLEPDVVNGLRKFNLGLGKRR